MPHQFTVDGQIESLEQKPTSRGSFTMAKIRHDDGVYEVACFGQEETSVRGLPPYTRNRFTLMLKCKEGQNGKWWLNLSLVSVANLQVAPPGAAPYTQQAQQPVQQQQAPYIPPQEHRDQQYHRAAPPDDDTPF